MGIYKMNTAARKFLQQKFKNNKIGGKGSVRRKKKNLKSKIISSRLNDEETTFLKEIVQTNESILSLKNDRLELWKVYFDDWVLDIVMGLRKKDFNKNHRNEFINIGEKYEEFFYPNFVKP